MNSFFLIFIGLPVLEIYLMIKMGAKIGAFNTIALIFLTAIIGVYFAKLQGIQTLKSGMVNIYQNKVPIYEILSGASIAIAALLLIVPGFFTDFKNKVMNVHPALIPSFSGPGYYGLKVHESVLAAGCKVTGASVHFVTPEVDAGPLILQLAVDVKQGDDPETLQHRVMEEAEWKIYPEAVRLFALGLLEVRGQQVYIND